jgi:ribosome-associated toxin RatA of RatAB toxin-antitoxin module
MHKSALVPYSASEMFALVNDIESYPRFLPWCTGATVESRDGNRLTASVQVRKGRVSQAFTTLNILEPHQSITMSLVRGPFKHLKGVWRFQPLGSEGCRVTLDMEFEFNSRAVQFAFGRIFSQITDSLVDAFCQEATVRYGQP